VLFRSGGLMTISLVLFVVLHVRVLFGEGEHEDTTTPKTAVDRNVVVHKMEGGLVGQNQSRFVVWKQKIEECITAEAIQGGRLALMCGPMIAPLCVFLLLRARTQLVDMDGEDYHTAELGMILVTVAVMLHVLDGLSIRVRSEFFGNVSFYAAIVFNLLGSGIVLWALVSLQSTVHPRTQLSRSLLGLAALYTVTSILTSSIRFAYCVIPSLAVACMYSHFRPWTTSDDAVPHFVSSCVYICIVSQYSMVVGGLCTSHGKNLTVDTAGAVIRGISLMLFTVFFAVLVFLLVTLPAATPAVKGILVLIVVSAVLSLWLCVVQEATIFRTAPADPARHQALLCNLQISSALTQLASLLLLYIHLRPNILLAEESSDDFLAAASPHLTAAVNVVLAGVLMQVVAEASQFFTSKISAPSVFGVGAGLLCMMIGIGMLMVDATAV